jgi:hypothetical protein
MNYMKLYSSIAAGEHVDVDRLRRRIERYRCALRRCAQRSKREHEKRAATEAAEVEDGRLVQSRASLPNRAPEPLIHTRRVMARPISECRRMATALALFVNKRTGRLRGRFVGRG